MNQVMTESQSNSLIRFSESAKYWQQNLADCSPLLELPTDQPRQSAINLGTEIHHIHLPTDLITALEILATAQKVSLPITLLTAFKVMIYRYVDRSDILIGSRLDECNLSTDVKLISDNLDKLVLKTNLSDSLTFSETLQLVNRVVVDARRYSDLSFDQILKILEIDQHPSYYPLFQVMFIWEQHPSVNPDQLDLRIKPVSFNLNSQSSNALDLQHSSTSSLADLDLILKLKQNPMGISGDFEYRSDLFAPATIDRIATHFQTLLESIVANPQQSIRKLPLLTPAERQQLLVDWNDTRAAYPQNQCVHQLFEAQAIKTPAAIAVEFTTDQLTYAELNFRANQLAHHLRSLGVDQDSLVGICVERSVEMIVGLLGILKAGGAYVPIDPNYPEARLSYLLDDSQVNILLTQARLLTKLPPSLAQTICLDQDWAEIARQQTSNPVSGVNFTNIAYVIYTSGSTGKPKGVKIQHKGFANYLNWCIQAYTVAQGSGAPVQSSISFDATITSIFSPLLVGQKVILLPEENEIEALVELLQSSDNFSLIKITPAHLEILKHLLPPAAAQGRTRALIVGGEALLGNNLAFWRDYAPQTKIINEYGPTETVVGCCIYEITPDTCLSAAIPIGRPIANTQLYILDRLLQPVPIGIKGELYIGGDGVAQGYWRRADLTAERFIPNPFSDDQAARLYKTGDLARYLPDGNIDYLGRIDHQVKIRGFRIELGEIETILGQYPDVERLVVVVNEDIPTNKRLIAYIVPQPDRSPQIDSLREFMARKLPEYAVPSMFVLLTELPLTPNGKVDRSALPAPASLRTESPIALIAPRDQLELELTQIWERIFGIELIGIGENFFELGGNSIIAVRLVAAIDRHWERNLPLSILLQYPTITELADFLRQNPVATPWSSLVPIELRGSKPPLFCIHPVGGNVLEYYPFALLGLDRPIYGLQSIGLDGAQIPLSQIEAMAAHYIQMMATIQPDGPYFVLGYSFGGSIAFEIACQLERQGKKIGLLALLDNASPNLAKTRPSLAKSVGIHFRNLQQLRMPERIQYIKDRLVFRIRYANRVDGEREFLLDNWAEPLRPEYLDVLAANLQAGQDYQGGMYAGSVTLFRSYIQPIAQALHRDLGWSELVSGSLNIYDMPGNHNNLLKEPYIQLLGQKLKICLSETNS
jgi:amino acid adenylation domain-containing protein